MKVSHERDLHDIHDRLCGPFDVRNNLCVLVFLELITFVAVAQTYLESEIGEIGEHLAVTGVKNSESVRRKKRGLGVRWIEAHPAERDTVLDTYHGIVIDLKDTVDLNSVKIDV